MDKLLEDESEDILKKRISTVDERTFWLATSNPEKMNEILEDEYIDEEEVVYVNRDPEEKIDTSTVKGTQGFFHVRGEGRVEYGEQQGYPLHTSTMACACEVCLDGRFRECPYLRERGNVKSFLLRKQKGTRKK